MQSVGSAPLDPFEMVKHSFLRHFLMEFFELKKKHPALFLRILPSFFDLLTHKKGTGS